MTPDAIAEELRALLPDLSLAGRRMVVDAVLSRAEQPGRISHVLTRLNVDWQTVRHECGDPKCGGDCRWVAELEDLLHLELS